MIGYHGLDGFVNELAVMLKDLPKPLGPADLEVLDELLRENGDCDCAEDFADHVKAIMAAYDKLYYGL